MWRKVDLKGKRDLKALKEVEHYKQLKAKGEDAQATYYRSLYYEFDKPENSALLQIEIIRRTIPVILNILQPAKGDYILEVGCGRGKYVFHCCREGADYVGLDLSLEDLALTTQMISVYDLKGTHKFVNADIIKLPFVCSRFDKVLCASVLEHLDFEQKIKALEEIYRVLKLEGMAVFFTDNLYATIMGVLYRRITAIFRGKNPHNYGIPFANTHIGLITLGRLKSLLKETGFKEMKKFYVFKQIRYIDKIMPIHKGAWIGRIPLIGRLFSSAFGIMAYKGC